MKTLKCVGNEKYEKNIKNKSFSYSGVSTHIDDLFFKKFRNPISKKKEVNYKCQQ